MSEFKKRLASCFSLLFSKMWKFWIAFVFIMLSTTETSHYFCDVKFEWNTARRGSRQLPTDDNDCEHAVHAQRHWLFSTWLDPVWLPGFWLNSIRSWKYCKSRWCFCKSLVYSRSENLGHRHQLEIFPFACLQRTMTGDGLRINHWHMIPELRRLTFQGTRLLMRRLWNHPCCGYLTTAMVPVVPTFIRSVHDSISIHNIR